jgi:23S rRNA (uracil1939-C5)-methyltransferase
MTKVKIDRIAPEGAGVARLGPSNLVVFVPYAVPGDVLEISLDEKRSSYARGRIVQVLAPGPDRIEPRCPFHFAPGKSARAFCGGCDWQQLGYEAQLRLKRDIVVDCLKRLAGLNDVPVLPTIASPRQWGYRNKVQVPFGAGAVAGFYAPGSHRIVDLTECAVQPELSVRIILKAKDILRRDANPWLRHLLIRLNGRNRALAAIVTKTRMIPPSGMVLSDELRKAFPEIVGLHHNAQPEESSVILGPHWRKLWGADALETKLGAFSFLLSPASFFQVNSGAAELLYDTALDFLRDGGARFDLALDLYCGVGPLAFWISRAVRTVIGVEENNAAVEDAWKNARRNGVTNVDFLAMKTEAAVSRLSKRLEGRVAAVADPPRSGLSPAARNLLRHPAIRRLVYVSCDPATFARDAKETGRFGFKLSKVQPVDLFPQTSHVELVGLLDRSKT